MDSRDPALPVMEPAMDPVMEPPLGIVPEHWHKVARPHISNQNGESATPHVVLVTLHQTQLRFISDEPLQLYQIALDDLNVCYRLRLRLRAGLRLRLILRLGLRLRL